MAYDDIDDEYDALEDSGSTAYFLAEEEKKKKEEQEKEEEKRKNFKIYFCENCGFIFDENKIGDTIENILKNNFKFGICPNCHSKTFKIVKESDIKKLKEKLKKKNKNDIEKKRDIINKNIQYDMKDLLEDLTDRLSTNKISVDSFINIFYRISLNIARRYAKDLPGSVDYSSYRKNILLLCKPALELYKVKEDAELIINKCDANIEESKLYIAEYKYYMNDDKYAIPDFEMQERIQEYESQKDELLNREYLKEVEERYQKRRKELEEKADKRIQSRMIRNLSI